MAPQTNVFDSPALPLLLMLQARGCHVGLTPDRLIVEPASRLTVEEQAAVQTHGRALALLIRCCDPSVCERRDVMRQQLAAAPPGRVPALLFRLDVPYVAGVCFSCGDRLHQFRVGRCWRCSLAWRLAARVPIPVELAEALDMARVVA